MLAYRFKITFENNDEFLRDVELATDQNFYDFFNFLMENLLLNKELSSAFYICDHKYRKKRPIYQPGYMPLVKTAGKAVKTHEQEDAGLYMDKCILSDFVDDPHQKFLFIYDLPNDWNFYIELVKIVQVDNRSTFPNIVKAIAPTPSELVRKTVSLPGITEEDDEEPDFDHGDETDPSPEDIHDVIIEEDDFETSSSVVIYDQENIEDFNDDEFTSDPVDMDDDFDESRQ